MRTVLILVLLAGITNPLAADESDPAVTTSYEVAVREAHHRIVERVVTAPGNDEPTTIRLPAYLELATGMHYRDEQGQWQEAREEIELLPDGAGAVARRGQHKVYFAPDLSADEVLDFETADGKQLRSRVFGLGYYDAASGQAVLLGVVKRSPGQLVAPNRLVYPDAFDEIHADVEYIYRRSGFEQNVILREQLPTPDEFALDPRTTRLQLLTEFINPPMPTKREESLRTGLLDEQLDFGVMQMGRGRAFLVGNETDESQVPVAKRWVTLEARTFLVEEVPLTLVARQIDTLPVRHRQASLGPERRGQGTNLIAAVHQKVPQRNARRSAGRMTLAKAARVNSVGFVMDYTILTSQSDFTFAANTNYYISGQVNLSGTTTIEGGTTIKFTNTPSAKISLSGPLLCLTDPYRPAVLTSRDDNTVGETISGSSGNPANANGATYLYSSISNPSNAIQYLRLSYAGTGLSFDGLTNGVWHCQFYKCVNGIDSYNQKEVRLYNVLMAVSSNCIVNSTTVRGEHLTVDVCSNLVSASGATLALTNSILTAVVASGVSSPVYDHVVTAPTGAGIYQTVGAASYYLAEGSTNRNGGTTNIYATLATALRSRTTYPPLVLSANITTETELSPQAMRDTDVPDVGYHYDPLDYVANLKSVTAGLMLSGGVAIGTYGASSSYGFRLGSGGSLVSEGTPVALNWIARYNTVQEQSVTTWSASSVGPSVSMLSSVPVSVKFTGWSVLGGTGKHFYDNTGSTTPVAFSHSYFGGGEYSSDSGSAALTNCLWQRVLVTLKDDAADLQYYVYNNLFYGGTLSYRFLSENTIARAYDNLFDRTTITKGSSSESFTHNYNGYVTNKNRLTPNGGNDVILTNNPVYLTGYLGRYYYPTNDGRLSRLLDAGSRSAANATLYHFTTLTNANSKEATSTVDIGFHYVGVNSSGQPIDTDGDGLPDYLEDSNGDGDVDSGETDWQDADDLGFQVFITQPKANSILP